MSTNLNQNNESKADLANISKDKIIKFSQTPINDTLAENQMEIKDVKKEENSNKSVSDKNLILQANQNRYYTVLNRLINSNRWIFFNLFLIILSALISFYAILTFFYPNLISYPIQIFQTLIAILILIDTIIRIYISGQDEYTKDHWNYLDGIVLVLFFLSILIYSLLGNVCDKIDIFVITCLVIIRNIACIKRIILYNKGYSNRIDEIVSFSTLFEEKKNENINDNLIKNKPNDPSISFVDEEGNKNKNDNK